MLKPSARILAGVSLWTLLVGAAQAQSNSAANSPANPTVALDEIVVTATRTPLDIEKSGSAISVVTAEDIAQQSAGNLVEVLRRVPGLSVIETGAGSPATVRIRGAESRHTLVLIDGVRVNDPSSATDEFDFVNLVTTDIERIEVLRGPQSALYGSDAIGGVINVITRKGAGAPRFSASAEGGSYGEKSARAAVSGSTGPLSYAFSLTGYDNAGFSRYGYRIGRIENTRLWPLEADGEQKLGASGRVGVKLSPDVEVEFGGYASYNGAQYDAAFGDYPDTPSQSNQRFFEGHSRLIAYTFDRALRNTFTISGSRTNRNYRDVSYFGFPLSTSWMNSTYTGDRASAEYQGDLDLKTYGLLTFGAKVERDSLISTASDVLPFATPEHETNDVSQTTRSLFAQHQITLIDHLRLTFGGRLDDIVDGDSFATWRTTASHDIPNTNTTLRSSLGTGAKAPSLFQQFDPTYGTPGLEAEHSVGFDIGVDQRLMNDRVVVSATFFANRFRNLIDFTFDANACAPNQVYGCYLNIDKARSSGVELSADVDLVPSFLRMKAVYTHTDAFDRETHERLARRPADEGRLGLVFTPAKGLSIEPSVIFVSSRYSSNGEQDKLQPYARFDIYADYEITDTFSLYARAENLTNTRYEDVYNYGTTGRAFYAGLRATW